MKTRPYKVTNLKTNSVRLIEGQNVSNVARYIVGTDYAIEACNGMDAVRIVEEGVKLESSMTAKSEVV
jgi:hypothetical protein